MPEACRVEEEQVVKAESIPPEEHTWYHVRETTMEAFPAMSQDIPRKVTTGCPEAMPALQIIELMRVSQTPGMTVTMGIRAAGMSVSMADTAVDMAIMGILTEPLLTVDMEALTGIHVSVMVTGMQHHLQEGPD